MQEEKIHPAWIEPFKTYSLNEALRLSPIKGYQTIRRYVDMGFLPATQEKHGYSILGEDLIIFIEKFNKGEFKEKL
jgi:hypothetical protein